MSTIENSGEKESQLSDRLWASLRGETDADADAATDRDAKDLDAQEYDALKRLRKEHRVSGSSGGGAVG